MPENLERHVDIDKELPDEDSLEMIVFYLPDSLSTLIVEKTEEQATSTSHVIERLIAVLDTFHGEILALQDPPKERILRPVFFSIEYRFIEMLVSRLYRTGLSQSQAIRRLLYAVLVTKELQIVVENWEIKLRKAQFNNAVDIKNG